MALDETTRWIIGIVVAILGVAATFVGAKYIRQNRQSQSADNGGTAVLGGKNAAGRDQGVTRYSAENQSAQTINNNNYFFGRSALQSQTMAEKADQESEFLEEKLKRKLDTNGEIIDEEVLNDIDFQIAIRMAKMACAKNDSDELKNRLVDLIIERSKTPTHSRLSHVLNKSIEKLSLLPDQELDCVVVLFVFGSIIMTRCDVEELIENLNNWLQNFTENLPLDGYCSEYLKYEGFAQQRIVGMSFWELFLQQFSGCISEGFTEEEYLTALGGFAQDAVSHPPLFVARSQNQQPVIKRFDVENRSHLEKLLPAQWPDTARQGVLRLFDEKQMPIETIKTRVLAGCPMLSSIEANWVSSGMSATVLTPLGRAIAHSVLTGSRGFSAPIEKWLGQ